MESSQWENLNHIFCHNLTFLIFRHGQYRGVGQGMRQTQMYFYFKFSAGKDKF